MIGPSKEKKKREKEVTAAVLCVNEVTAANHQYCCYQLITPSNGGTPFFLCLARDATSTVKFFSDPALTG